MLLPIHKALTQVFAMNLLKKGIENQSLGLLPILLFMILDNFFAYRLSFFIAMTFCTLSLVVYKFLQKGRVYMYMLLLTTATMVLYSLFMCLRLRPVLYTYSPLLIELILVCVLSAVRFYKKKVFRRLRDSGIPQLQKVKQRNMLSEFYYVVPIIKNAYTIHLLAVVFCGILPGFAQSEIFQRFLLHTLPVILGFCIIVYEQIRLMMLQDKLDKEAWFPVLSDDGRVIGRIAASVSRSVAKKFYHPIVRVMIVYKGMLYLGKRAADSYVSPGKWDTPFYNNIQFKQTIEDAAQSVVSGLGQMANAPRFLARYTYESGQVKHLVSLFAISLDDDQMKEMNTCKAKFWTAGQIDENFHTGIFSEYLTEEYDYLRNTIMHTE